MAEPTSLTRRERQAKQTRGEILQAARVLFAQHGYSRTSVRDIAKTAGVSAQTVYDSVGSKRALVGALNDLIDAEADIARLAREGIGADDPAVVAGTSARVTRSILEHCGDIVQALTTGAAAEPELAAVLAEGHRRHLAGARSVVAALEAKGALAASIEAGEAAETMAALADISLGLVLRDTYGWSLDRVESWVADTTRALVLDH
ncbi:MAG: TetR/AcrR family transcriptional regulator [Acidimicrobiia bacterium]|nr:TetR/AcrR family transcriptional regulator [Acidimicrobiia bacterium]